MQLIQKRLICFVQKVHISEGRCETSVLRWLVVSELRQNEVGQRVKVQVVIYTTLQFGDLFTKGLGAQQLRFLLGNLGVCNLRIPT
ncbi:hypothetical protein HanPI659440_Chr15g0591021 [Helianthus annuus]|nr:hypothetical protein HanPI659440_Chr15g0591021 [Helianthus annuus]